MSLTAQCAQVAGFLVAFRLFLFLRPMVDRRQKQAYGHSTDQDTP